MSVKKFVFPVEEESQEELSKLKYREEVLV
jgi:hypothetical protein